MGVDSIARALAVKPVGIMDYVAPSTDLASGLVSGGTVTTLVDTSATWVGDEWKNKVVKIYRDSGTDFEYGVVISNTADTLTFDDDLIFEPCLGCEYEIMNTVELDPCQLPLMLALNITDNQCAVLLPESTTNIERQYLHVYIERSMNGNYIVPVIARGLERMAGAKNLTLEHYGEGVRLYPHQWYTPHWDIAMVYNVKRLASGYVLTDIPIDTTEYDYIDGETNIVYDNKKRFIEHIVDGNKWLRYTSLINRDFNVSFTAIVEKTGSGGEAMMALAKKDFNTGSIEVLDERLAQTLFGGGDGIQTVTFDRPVSLARNDEIIIVAKRTSGTFNVKAGSSITVTEF